MPPQDGPDAGEDPLVMAPDDDESEDEFVDTSSTFSPPKPIMGGLRFIDDKHQAPWTGGKPKADWLGLVDPSPPNIAPTQFRTTSISSSTKSQVYRQRGLSTKLSSGQDLISFQREVIRFFTSRGMDSITYLPNPMDSNNMVSIITDFGMFTMKSARELESNLEPLYDDYDRNNSHDAREFLLNSVSPRLKQQLNEHCEIDGSFIEYWMRLMHIIRPTHLELYTRMKEALKTRKLQDYPGQNVELLCSAYWSDYRSLHGAGMYDHQLTFHMASTLMSGCGTEDYNVRIRPFKNKINRRALDIRHKTYTTRSSRRQEWRTVIRTLSQAPACVSVLMWTANR